MAINDPTALQTATRQPLLRVPNNRCRALCRLRLR
jgi:hypothetical protein